MVLARTVLATLCAARAATDWLHGPATVEGRVAFMLVAAFTLWLFAEAIGRAMRTEGHRKGDTPYRSPVPRAAGGQESRGQPEMVAAYQSEYVHAMSRIKPSLSTAIGALTLLSLAPLLVWDAAPSLFPARAHDLLGAAPLTLVAFAYLVYQAVRRVSVLEFAKTILCALAFIFWALNQLLPEHRQATLFNDIAVTAFVVDLVLVIFGWPPNTAATTKSSDRRPRANEEQAEGG